MTALLAVPSRVPVDEAVKLTDQATWALAAVEVSVAVTPATAWAAVRVTDADAGWVSADVEAEKDTGPVVTGLVTP